MSKPPQSPLASRDATLELASLAESLDYLKSDFPLCDLGRLECCVWIMHQVAGAHDSAGRHGVYEGACRAEARPTADGRFDMADFMDAEEVL